MLNAQVITFNKTFHDSLANSNNASALTTRPIEYNDGYIYGFAGISPSIINGSYISLIKINKTGEEVWRSEKHSYEFRYSRGNIISDSQNDSSLYFCYTQDSLHLGIGRLGQLKLQKFDKNGNSLWDKRYNTLQPPSNADVARDLVLFNDKIYISTSWVDTSISGFTPGYYKNALYCIDKEGSLLWVQNYDSGGNIDYNYSLIVGADSAIYLTGITNGLGASGWRGHLIKTDMQGNMIWQKLYPEIGDGGLMTINYLDENKFILTGYNFNQGQPGVRGKIIKIDTSGTITQSLTFPEGTLSVTLYRSAQIADGNLISVGISNKDGPGTNCGLIQKSTPTGSLLWRHRHDFNEHTDYFIDFIETTDGGFLVTGVAFVDFVTGQDAWLLKLDGNGCLEPGCLEVGINEAEQEIGITIYPNPTLDRLFIKTEQNLMKPLNFSLYNMQGQLIIQEQLVAEYESFDLSNLSTGVYLVNIIDANGKKVSKRIVKN